MLTEVGNLLGAGHGPIQKALFRTLADFIETAVELSLAGRAVCRDERFSRLGLTDLAVAAIASGGHAVATIDADLIGLLTERNVETIDFRAFLT